MAFAVIMKVFFYTDLLVLRAGSILILGPLDERELKTSRYAQVF
jgi:hypothetical protein